MISMTLILFYGSIMYLIGHGDFKVTEEYPEGLIARVLTCQGYSA
jgi:hypothetical protein